MTTDAERNMAGLEQYERTLRTDEDQRPGLNSPSSLGITGKNVPRMALRSREISRVPAWKCDRQSASRLRFPSHPARGPAATRAERVLAVARSVSHRGRDVRDLCGTLPGPVGSAG
jgi:hypothetical protein